MSLKSALYYIVSSLLTFSYVFQTTTLHEEIVDSISRNPHHWGERHDEADAVGPEGVLHGAVLDGGPTNNVEQEDGLKIGIG